MRMLRPVTVLSLAVIPCLNLTVKAQAPAGPSGWARVQGLPANTEVHLQTDKQKTNCAVGSVTDDQLTCSSVIYQRTEIKSVKLPRKGTSTVGGLLIGAGAGAGIGAGIGSAINSSDKGSYVHVSGGKSAGVGAGIGAIIGVGIGALVGHATDMFASTVYKR